MQRQQIQLYLSAFGLIGIMLTMAACFNEPNYSNTPEIGPSFVYRYPKAAQPGVGRGRRDSVVISVDFKDGDGNLGNDIPVPSADSDRYASNGGWGNYRIKTLRLIDNRYVEFAQDQIVNTTLFFPDLAKNKPKGPIEGTLDFNQTFQYTTGYRIYPIKFQITIRDRGLQESNMIETDTVWVPFPR